MGQNYHGNLLQYFFITSAPGRVFGHRQLGRWFAEAEADRGPWPCPPPCLSRLQERLEVLEGAFSSCSCFQTPPPESGNKPH